MDAKVSVIMPVYNGAEKIGVSIESALAQTLQEIELICVDDCSSDGTAEVVEGYAARDARVRLLRHERNMGRLTARRTGTLAARGRYVMYLDADDALEPHACAAALAAIERERADVVHFMTRYRRSDAFESAPDAKAIMSSDAEGAGAWQGVRPGVEVLDRFFVTKALHWSVWSKICTAELAKRVYNLFGEERGDICEDAMVTFLLLASAKRVAYLADALYVYHLGVGITAAFNEAKARAVATEYNMYRLLDGCLTDAQKADKRVRVSMTALHDDMMDAVMWHALHLEGPKLDALSQALAKYCALPAFIAELRGYQLREAGRQRAAERADREKHGPVYRALRRGYHALKRALGRE